MMNRSTMEHLAERIRGHFEGGAEIVEKRMFGGTCFMLNGNMLCAASQNGDLMLRVGKERNDEALASPETRPMDKTGRPMKGFIYVAAEAVATKEDLARWIAYARTFVDTLPKK